jgi:hypothetical protein
MNWIISYFSIEDGNFDPRKSKILGGVKTMDWYLKAFFSTQSCFDLYEVLQCLKVVDFQKIESGSMIFSKKPIISDLNMADLSRI